MRLPGIPAEDLPEHTSTYGVRPWERQAREPDDAWRLFVAYRDSGYPDGLSGTFRARDLGTLAAVEPNASTGFLKRLASTHNWAERAGAFDRELDHRRNEARMSMRDRDDLIAQRIASKMCFVGEQVLDMAIARVESGETWTNSELRQWLIESSKHKRLLNGQSTENVSVECKYDLSKLTLDEMETFRALEAKMRLPAPADAPAPMAPDLTN